MCMITTHASIIEIMDNVCICRRAVPHFDIEDTLHVIFELFHLFRCISVGGITTDLAVREMYR